MPIAGETLGEPSVYGDDRLFVRLRARATTATRTRRDRAMRALSSAPIATIDFAEPAALGAEFVRWEIATAVAGALLGINPFDEPNVQQAKDATRVLLDRYKADGQLPIDRARSDHCRRRHADADDGRARRALDGRGADAIPDAARAGRLPRRCSPTSVPTPALGDALHALPHGRPRSHARGHDVRLRAALPALDRPAAQGRAEHRRLRADHRDAGRGPADSRASRSRSARSSSRRRSAISRRSTPPAAARCTCTCRRPIRALLDAADAAARRGCLDGCIAREPRTGDAHATRLRRPRQDGPEHGDAPRRAAATTSSPSTAAPTPSRARAAVGRARRRRRSTRSSRRCTAPRASG